MDREEDEKCEMIDDSSKMVIEAAKEAEEASRQLRKARERHRSLANVLDKVEEKVNAALAGLKTAFVASISTTCSWSCGTGDRADNERVCLDGVSFHDDGLEEVVEEGR